MHTIKYEEFVLHHDGDFQGNVVIACERGEITVPSDLLRYFVAEQTRQKIISDLEQQSDNQVLGLEEKIDVDRR